MKKISETDKTLIRIEKAYLKDPGSCPFCQSTSISGGQLEVDGSQVWQEIICLEPNCGAVWTDLYRLEGITLY